ncbi:Hypothetical predicted protein [Mytilus galloprovincialis]|uniref:C2H2-type domain-containing protein n=1 Tax=Mytilus galloprovincialis TaxID=29158 RepID=A0A8B6E016_MYTGA|nr:Hypothetical predicted protein [Mytilus galloprovincialis]
MQIVHHDRLKPFFCDVQNWVNEHYKKIKELTKLLTLWLPLMTFFCFHCGAQYNLRSQLTRHVRDKHPKKMLQCRFCSYLVPTSKRFRLMEHEKNVHRHIMNPRTKDRELHNTRNSDQKTSANHLNFPIQDKVATLSLGQTGCGRAHRRTHYGTEQPTPEPSTATSIMRDSRHLELPAIGMKSVLKTDFRPHPPASSVPMKLPSAYPSFHSLKSKDTQTEELQLQQTSTQTEDKRVVLATTATQTRRVVKKETEVQTEDCRIVVEKETEEELDLDIEEEYMDFDFYH